MDSTLTGIDATDLTSLHTPRMGFSHLLKSQPPSFSFSFSFSFSYFFFLPFCLFAFPQFPFAAAARAKGKSSTLFSPVEIKIISAGLQASATVKGMVGRLLLNDLPCQRITFFFFFFVFLFFFPIHAWLGESVDGWGRVLGLSEGGRDAADGRNM